MRIRVLGCHGSTDIIRLEAEWHRCCTCGFLLDDSVLLDAGTIGTSLTHDEQKSVRHVLLSHLHHDHIKALPALADNMIEEIQGSITVASIPEVLNGLREHVFNDEVFPNFFDLPAVHNPLLTAQALTFGQFSTVGSFEVLPIAVNHLVPTAGFIIRDSTSAILYSADTYSTEELWKVAKEESTLKAALIEVSFPNSKAEVAKSSKHLTPSLFAEAIHKLGQPNLHVYAYHLKPRFREQIVSELQALGLPNLKILLEGEVITI